VTFLLLILISQISVDIGRFKAADEFTLCEIYVSLPYSEVSYTQKKGILESAFKLRLAIETADSHEIVQEFDKISHINSYEEAESRNLCILDKIDAFLVPGEYDMKIEVISDSVRKGVERSFEIELPEAGVYLSDIQIGTSIEAADSGKFVKNGLRIIPYPEAIFGVKYPTLYVYAEMYNLKAGVAYDVNYSVISGENDSVYTLSSRTDSVTSSDITKWASVDVSAFAEGGYTIRLTVIQDSVTVVREKEFYVAKEMKREEFQFTAEELEYCNLIKYVASRKEIKLYKSLSETAKRQYLADFWRRAGRPLLHSLIERVKYVDATFAAMGRQGRDTDRGRLWIRYGKPDEIEKISFSRSYHCNEKWSYFGGGGKFFIFVDRLDDGRYELMYSSIPEESTALDYGEYVNPEALSR
jgi:GWxTD domain-containing protein